MYEKTKQLILEKQKQGIFPGAVFQWICAGKKETHVIGESQKIPIQTKMTKETLFDVASLTKVVGTTTVLLRLMEQGEIEIDATLQTYLPEFKDGQVTLRQLLTHSADLQTWIVNRNQLTSSQLRQAYLQVQSGSERGKKVQYTDTGMLLLGFMLERYYQKPVATIFQHHVFDPLKMSNSTYFPENTKQIAATQQLADGKILKGVVHDPKARVLGIHAGNAGLFSNLADLNRFVAMYLSWGEDYLKKETIEKLLNDWSQVPGEQRSLGWDLKEKDTLFHTGYTGTFLAIDPVKQEAFIFLSNRVHPNDNREVYIAHREEILIQYFAEKRT